MKKWLGEDNSRLWLVIVGTAALVIAGAYTIAQQSTRLGADDLPLQSAQTIEAQLDSGVSPQDVVPTLKTDLRTDDTLFAIITNKDQDILSSSATLDGKTPIPPTGVFSYTSAHGTDHFTWQPASGVRLATRVLTYNGNSGGYIITGQSLAPAENRITIYGELAIATLVAVVAWATLMLLVLNPSYKNRK